jgi:hypothetical protein
MGLILVFDLDQTIVDTQDTFFNKPRSMINTLKEQIRPFLNENIVNLLIRASKLRHKQVSAICLLTNNSDIVFISAVDSLLRELCNSTGKYRYNNEDDLYSYYMPIKDYFFDAIMPRDHSMRSSLTKSVKDVKVMMDILNEKIVLDDIYFFDDMPHVMDSEIKNSIKIQPAFVRNIKDLTDYTPILERLSAIDGQPAELPMLTLPTVQTVQTVPRLPTRQTLKTFANPLFVRRSTPTTVVNPLRVQETRRFGRNRSNNGEINESEFPPTPQESSIRRGTNLSKLLGNMPKKTTARPSLPFGGRRSRRLLKKHRNKTRNRFRK